MLLTFPTTDAALVRQILRGRTDKFGEVVRRYHPVLLGLALSHVRNQSDAEDIVQESFVRAYENLPKLRDESKLGAWLATITRSRCINLLQKRQREIPLTAVHEQAVAPPDTERKEAHDLLLDGLQRVEPDTREILMLYYFAKKDTRQIASLLEISVDAARKRLQRARTVLGQELVDVLGDQVRPSDPRLPVKRILALLPPLGYGASAHAAGVGLVAASAGTKWAFGGLALILCALSVSILSPSFRATPPQASPVTPIVPEEKSEEEAPAESVDAVPPPAMAPGAEAVPTAPQAEISQPEGSISGVVVDMEGKPLPDMSVQAEWEGGRAATKDRTDAAGQFFIGTVRAGGCSLQAYPWEVMGYTERQDLLVEVQAGQVLEDVVIVYPGLADLSISGRVLDAQRRPVEGAEVEFNTGTFFTVETSEDGSFVARFLEDREYALKAVRPGYENTQEPLRVAAGTQGVQLVLEGYATVSGRVVDAKNQPVPGARVMATPLYHRVSSPLDILDPWKDNLPAADEKGNFTLTNVPAGEVGITAVGKGFAPAQVRLDDLRVGEHRAQVVVQLAKGSSVLFTVQDAAGAPVSTASVRLGRGELALPDRKDRYVGAAVLMPTSHTHGIGQYEFSALPPGNTEFLVVAPGFAPSHVRVLVPEVGEVQESVTLKKEAVILGQVTLDGKPLTNGGVSLSAVGQSALGDAWVEVKDGRYQIDGVHPGLIRVSAGARQANHEDGVRQQREVQVRAGDRVECNFDLQTGTAAVEGFVTSNGEPEKSPVKIVIEQDNGPRIFSTWSRNEDGYYSIQGIPDGAATISAERSGPNPLRASATVHLVGGQSARQDLAMEDGSNTVSFTVANVPPNQYLAVRLMKDFPVPARLDVQMVERIDEVMAHGITFPPEIEMAQSGEWDKVKPGNYTLVVFAYEDRTEDAYANALITSVPVIVEDGVETPEVVLSF